MKSVFQIFIILDRITVSVQPKYLLLCLHHTGGQEIVQVEEGAVLIVHVGPEPGRVTVLRV